MKFTRILTALLVICIFASGTTVSAFAKSDTLTTHIGTVDATTLRLRSGPSTSSSILKTAYSGDYVIITGKSGSWYKVEFNLTSGYMHADYLNTHTRKNVELGHGRVNANKVNVRSGPGTSYGSLARANSGEKAYIIGFNNQWYKVIYNDDIGYIRSDYLDLTEIPYENKASTKTPKFFVNGNSTGVTPSTAALNGTTVSRRQTIVANAKKLIGTPYVWGGTTTRGFDCSGFVQHVMKISGITLPRTTAQQAKVGTYVSKANLQPGDLVFLQNTYRAGVSHVGIYIGDGKVIHASSSKGVTTSSLTGSYFAQHYHSARRVV